MKTILILESNPRQDLDLNEEIRELTSVIEQSRNGEQFDVKIALAVRPKDLQKLLLKYKPQIVHFCGHGTGEQGLVLQNDAGQEQRVTTEALSDLFELFAEQIECVLLNACYSDVQANAIAQHVEYVVGMKQEIQDDAAIAFATGFYQALAYGESIERAYKFGCTEVHLTISGDSAVRSIDTPIRKLEAIDAVERKLIPEHLRPVLTAKRSLKKSITSSGIDLDPSPSPTVNTSSNPNAIPKQEAHRQLQLTPTDNFHAASAIDYTKLKNLLQAANWKAAEEETLSLMLRVAKREQKGWLGEADIKNFPCVDLSQINDLWSSHSSKRFSFSVQKQIYLECGNKLDGRHDEAIWLRFADQVGWLKEGNLISYSEVTFSSSNPLGYFPFRIYREGCLQVGACAWWVLRFLSCGL
ncbi:GUN4 domain-containing protein [Phormidium tenue FACHB-886]|nr:GUN4 domain-containing protein [Phormidium tenue FACHB-886]